MANAPEVRDLKSGRDIRGRELTDVSRHLQSNVSGSFGPVVDGRPVRFLRIGRGDKVDAGQTLACGCQAGEQNFLAPVMWIDSYHCRRLRPSMLRADSLGGLTEAIHEFRNEYGGGSEANLDQHSACSYFIGKQVFDASHDFVGSADGSTTKGDAQRTIDVTQTPLPRCVRCHQVGAIPLPVVRRDTFPARDHGVHSGRSLLMDVDVGLRQGCDIPQGKRWKS